MREPLKRSAVLCGIWLLASSGAAVALLMLGQDQPRVSKQTRNIAAALTPDRIWYSPGGSLLGARKSGAILTIWRYGDSRTRASARAVPVADGALWAVSPDGLAVAWAAGNKLGTSELDRVRPAMRTVEVAPNLIGFTESGVLILVSDAGTIEFVDRRGLFVRARSTLRIEHPDLLCSSGHFVAVGSRGARQVEVLDIQEFPSVSVIERRTFEVGFREMAVSESGRVAVIESAGRVRDIAFADEDRLVTVNDAGDVRLLNRDNSSVELLKVAEGNQAIAARGREVAAIGAKGLAIARFQDSGGIGVWVLIGWLAANLLVLGTWWVVARRRRLRRESTRRRGVDPRNTLAGAVIPEDLMREIAEGNCVLLAGEGLSVAAGYPDWARFVQEHADPLEQGHLLESARRVYSEPSVATPLHASLRELPFVSVLTSVLDPQVAAAFAERRPMRLTPDDSVYLPPVLVRRDFVLLHSRGHLEAPETVSLTAPGPGSLDSRYNDFLSEIFETRKVLIVGAGLRELSAWAGRLTGTDERRPWHYALVPMDSSDSLEALAALSAEHRIHVLTYPKLDPRPLQRFLACLAREIAMARPNAV